jgi:glycine cleavage system aminomethyltransferase T
MGTTVYVPMPDTTHAARIVPLNAYDPEGARLKL